MTTKINVLVSDLDLQKNKRTNSSIKRVCSCLDTLATKLAREWINSTVSSEFVSMAA